MGAGLDVVEKEPPDEDDPILNNVILAPQALCSTDQCFARNGAVARCWTFSMAGSRARSATARF
jgi:phosphoglycerate dehydrogenase-like enzyme